ncbi:MAG: alpha/beta fold hydrolase [Thermaerobacter sp.]|nr:alpha/beta fold hydrolase [Thermaerobacter sp.]
MTTKTEVTVASDGLKLEMGGWLPEATVAVETWGAPSRPVVLVCHALTGDAHVARHQVDDRPGWWEWLVGPGRPLDPDRVQIVATNVLGGSAGTTGPACVDPTAAFPAITVGDMVQVEALALDRLGIGRVALVIGGSLGGMRALEWLAALPDRVGAVAGMGVSSGLSALALGQNHVQLAALEWGLAHGPEAARAALGWARMTAMLTYRSADHLDARFGRATGPVGDFRVASYLDHQAEKLIARFHPASYHRLAEAMGRWQLDVRRLVGATAAVRLLGLERDGLFPPEDVRDTARRMAAVGVDAQYQELANAVGHDAFLMPGALGLDAWVAGVVDEAVGERTRAADAVAGAPWS